MTVDRDTLIALLNKQADEIAAAGHAGWGNTMREAALVLASQKGEPVMYACANCQGAAFGCNCDNKSMTVPLYAAPQGEDAKSRATSNTYSSHPLTYEEYIATPELAEVDLSKWTELK